MFVCSRPGNFRATNSRRTKPIIDTIAVVEDEQNNLLECKPRPLRRERLLVRRGCTELISVPPFLFDVGQLGVDDLVSVGALLHNRIVLHLKVRGSNTAQSSIAVAYRKKLRAT